MNKISLKLLGQGILLAALCLIARAEEPSDIKFNKLREMYTFYYLPFNLHFKVGSEINDIFPVTRDKLGDLTQPVGPEEMKKLEKQWLPTRDNWKKKSLFLTTPVDSGKTVRISERLISHKISVKQTAVDLLAFSERLKLRQSLEDKTPDAQANIVQLKFLQAFLDQNDKTRFNFFIFSPSWCASSQEYRALFEAYFKKFANTNLALHSVVIDDPQEVIFDSKIFKELFPHTPTYSHDLVPRFLAYEERDGVPTIYEEGQALSVLYENFFKQHQGFLNKLVSGILPEVIGRDSNPFLSSSIAKFPKVAQ